MFGSTWGQSNQQQQPQQPQGFGQTTGFGAFGGQQSQQQPGANPMFGNLNSNPPAAGNTGFGAFGASTPAQNTASTSLFGAPKPTGGFGAFGGGGTSTFGGGGTGTFGQPSNNAAGPSNTSSVFGGNTTNTGAFGGSSTAFGANKPTAFGTTGTTTNPTEPGTYNAGPPVTTGTSNPPYSVFSEKDGTSSTMVQYQSITCMPPYRGTSFEELRLQDYMQGRKTAGAFGQSAAFGTQPATQSTGIFGQPAQTQPTTSIFGASATPAAGTSGFGAFGQPQQPQQQPQQQTTGAFGAFGQTQQQPQQQQPTGFGAFGQTQPQQPAQTGSIFGGGNAFGANKPATGAFGTTNTTGAFGSGTTSLFGQTAQQQQPQQPQQNAFGQPAQGTGIFGGGTFGANNTAQKPAFGAPQTTTQPTTTGFGAFGQPAQQTQPQTGTSIFGGGNAFGQTAQQQPQQGAPQTSLFGSTTQQPATGGGLFGNSIFGNNQQPQQNAQAQPAQQSGFGIFGQKPATPAAQQQPNIFGSFGASTNASTTTPQQGIFGGLSNQAAGQQPANNTSLFGAPKPAAPALGASQSTSMGGSTLFGNTFGQNNNSFQASTTAGTAQGTLTASISQPIGANLPIFSLLPPGPRSIAVENQPKKKASFFVDVPTRSPVPRVQLGYAPANSKLRGFGSSTNLGSSASNPFASSLNFSMGKPNALSLTKGASTGAIDGFSRGRSSPLLGSGGRQSVKKLILDKKVEPNDLFTRSGSPSPGIRGAITFSPALGAAARERDAATATTPVQPPAPTPRSTRTPNRFTAASMANIADGEAPDSLKEGDYWSKPDLQSLIASGHADLRSCKNLIVGRIGYGEVHFLEPVDLTGLTKLSQLYGDIVRFDDKECCVYPDIDESEKPVPGTHLNTRARIILIRCWPNDKSTREPIKDEAHPAMIKHIKKLRNMRDTKFESFDAEEGKWTFTVEHF